MSRRFLVLVNPAAAGGRAVGNLSPVTTELERLGAPYRVSTTRSLDDAKAQAASAAQDGETVAALGGDGFLRPIASALRGTKSALAIIPGGRGNDLARVLAVPKDPVQAARLAVEGREQKIDMALLDGIPYLGIASFGFDSDANRIANQARLVKGNLVYLYAALRALVAWRPATFTVTVDGERHEFTGYSVAVANSRSYGGGMLMAPHAELDDGQLDVVMTGSVSKLRALRSLPKLFNGTHIDDPNIHTARGSVVEVAADRPFDIYADGDAVGALPTTMRIEPRCLRVIVPR